MLKLGNAYRVVTADLQRLVALDVTAKETSARDAAAGSQERCRHA
ncbi:hypothetical protein [Streptomyces goshikiensis]